MVLEGRSELGEAAIIDRAMEYFGRQLGMSVVSQTVNAMSFQGERGAVNVTVYERGPDSEVHALSDGLDEEVTEFMHSIAQIVGG